MLCLTSNKKKIKRSAKLLQVSSKYGLQDMLSRISNGSDSDSEKNKAGYERLRLALEELGPSFVKLGQSFSNRDDLLPKDFILELQKLQDRVEVVDMDVKMILEKSLDIVVDEYFNYINTMPIAAASIAQVNKAQLKNGQDVILKIKRPNIVGFVCYHYKYKSGHEDDAPILGFAPRKTEFSLYVFTGLEEHDYLLKDLGKFKMGKACIYVKKLFDINIDALKILMRESINYISEKYERTT